MRLINKRMVIVCLIAQASMSFASGMNAGEALKQADEYLRAGEYDKAAETMQRYLEEVQSSKTPGVVAKAQSTRFTLATLLINRGRSDDGTQHAARQCHHVLRARRGTRTS